VSGGSSILLRLALLSGIAVGALLISRSLLVTEIPRDDAPAMREAGDSAAAWFSLVDSLKRHAGMVAEQPATMPFRRANQPEVTWLGMESCVAAHGGLRYRSAMVTMGAEGDTGGGLSDEGRQMLRSAALRNGVKLRTPRSFHEAVSSRADLLAKTQLVINIGGSQASLGMCPHAPVLSHGIITRLPECAHPDRGLIERLVARGIPVIHLLSIEALAAEHHLPRGPASLVRGTGEAVYATRAIHRGPAAVLLAVLLAATVLLRPPKAAIRAFLLVKIMITIHGVPRGPRAPHVTRKTPP
jgi:hypothetical protein